MLQIPTLLHSQVGLQGIRSRSKPSKSGIELEVKRERRVRNDAHLPPNTSPAKISVKGTSSAVVFDTILDKSMENVAPAKLNESSMSDTEKISRHLAPDKPTTYDDHSETGFLWSWNFTVSKRWKQISNTGATGDIDFMDKMLADFRAFCANHDNRLKTFWDECWAQKFAYEEAQNINESSEFLN